MSSNSEDQTPSTRVQILLAALRGTASGIARAVAEIILEHLGLGR